MHFENWKDAVQHWDSERWPNFTVKEVAQRGFGWEEGETPVLIVPEFIDQVQAIRNAVGPMNVSSWYRSPAYNDQVSSSGTDGPHTTGRAIDVKCSGAKAVKVMEVALALGMTGFGISQKGAHDKRFVHLDNLSDNETPGPRPWIWSY